MWWPSSLHTCIILEMIPDSQTITLQYLMGVIFCTSKTHTKVHEKNHFGGRVCLEGNHDYVVRLVSTFVLWQTYIYIGTTSPGMIEFTTGTRTIISAYLLSPSMLLHDFSHVKETNFAFIMNKFLFLTLFHAVEVWNWHMPGNNG